MGLTMVAVGLMAASLTSGGYKRATPVSVDYYEPGVCKATDGDTIRCGDERIRLVEIDAPEMPGHCRRGRVCVNGDPYASKAALQRMVADTAAKIVRYGTDRYGRTLADVQFRNLSASCMQIKGGYAEQQLKWGSYGVTGNCR